LQCQNQAELVQRAHQEEISDIIHMNQGIPPADMS
jgi:hypothetical protein